MLIRERKSPKERAPPPSSARQRPGFRKDPGLLLFSSCIAAVWRTFFQSSSWRGDRRSGPSSAHFGVSMHSVATRNGVGGAGCARPWPRLVQRDTASDGMLARGHNRSDASSAFIRMAPIPTFPHRRWGKGWRSHPSPGYAGGGSGWGQTQYRQEKEIHHETVRRRRALLSRSLVNVARATRPRRA